MPNKARHDAILWIKLMPYILKILDISTNNYIEAKLNIYVFINFCMSAMLSIVNFKNVQRAFIMLKKRIVPKNEKLINLNKRICK